MHAYLFPGQGSQFVGMGKDLFDSVPACQSLFEQANQILGFDITGIMFHGTDEDLKQTRVTQPAVFLHSVACAVALKDQFQPDMVAGHSLGEFSALAAIGAISFADGLRLVHTRASAMQQCCQTTPSTMAAVVKLSDDIVKEICNAITDEVVVAANYNCPGQVVISGSLTGIAQASAIVKERGGRALPMAVGGAFHSPLMEPARQQLAEAINKTPFNTPRCPIYQNVCATPTSDANEIKENLIAQLTSPVRWTETIQNMIIHHADRFTELGPGNVLKGLLKRIDSNAVCD